MRLDVVSRTRYYGRLMAACPAGGFLPQEREQFAVYARYAASVLDTATALDDARRQHRQSRALLELSQAVGRVSTGDEVAQRLVAAVPAVVDCDRVAVFLWNDREEALTRMGQALDSFILEGVTTTIPFLARVIRHPDFAAGNVDTRFLEREPQLLRPDA